MKTSQQNNIIVRNANYWIIYFCRELWAHKNVPTSEQSLKDKIILVTYTSCSHKPDKKSMVNRIKFTYVFYVYFILQLQLLLFNF